MRDRTADLLHAMQALSQLSYSPKWVPDLRLTPLTYSTGAEPAVNTLCCISSSYAHSTDQTQSFRARCAISNTLDDNDWVAKMVSSALAIILPRVAS